MFEYIGLLLLEDACMCIMAFTNHISSGLNAVSSVHLSVHPFVATLSSEPIDL